MKIKRKDNIEVEFKDVDYGEAFEYIDKVYIKINPFNEDGNNAVRLEDGLTDYFCDIICVKIIKAELVIGE